MSHEAVSYAGYGALCVSCLLVGVLIGACASWRGYVSNRIERVAPMTFANSDDARSKGYPVAAAKIKAIEDALAHVTPAQVAAAKLKIERATARGETVDPAVVAIAHTSPSTSRHDADT